MHSDRFYTLSASCPDQVGIIAKVSGFIAGHGGWILESSFHSDALTSRYFMRLEIKANSLPCLLAEFRERFRTEVAEPLQMDWRINDSAVKKRVVVLVSKQEHCLYDLLAGQGTRHRDSLRHFQPRYLPRLRRMARHSLPPCAGDRRQQAGSLCRDAA